MKYTGEPVGRKRNTPFTQNIEYDDRQIVRLARQSGLRVVRPNGDIRIRGSRRLIVVDPASHGSKVYVFTAVGYKDQPIIRL